VIANDAGRPRNGQRAATTLCFSGISGSLAEGTESIELLNENAMGPVRYIHKSGTGRQSICHNGLLIDVVLRLIANQDSILGRSWIYVIQFSFVCDGGNLAGWQRSSLVAAV
jgi:hypothetical protein